MTSFQSTPLESCIQFNFNWRISQLTWCGRLLSPYNNSFVRASFERLAKPNGRIMCRFWREDFDEDIRKNWSATKSVPHRQFHHLKSTLDLLCP